MLSVITVGFTGMIWFKKGSMARPRSKTVTPIMIYTLRYRFNTLATPASSFSAKGLYREYTKADPIPSSAKESTDKILENKPLIPKYSMAKYFINMVRLTKPKMVKIICETTPELMFFNEFTVLLLVFKPLELLLIFHFILFLHNFSLYKTFSKQSLV